MRDSFNVRLYQPGDLPGILQLWEHHSGWGGITAQQWHSWYINTPWGESVVVVVEDLEKQIVGQGILTPFPFRLTERTGTAYRISAPILREGIRAGRVTNPEHPSRRMLDIGVSAVRARGGLAAYTLPVISWRGFFRRIPGFVVQEYGCARIELSNALVQGESGLAVETADAFGVEHSHLWRDALSQLPIQAALERSAALWNYRLQGKLVLNVKTRSGDLVGYLAIKKESGLVVDLLARNRTDLQQVIMAAVGAVAKQRSYLGNIPSALKMMVTPQLEPIVKELELPLDDFRFLFSVVPTEEGLEPQSIAPTHWYLTAGD